MQVRGDGSGNAIGLQIGAMDGKYFHYDIKLDFEGWKQLEIPLVGNDELTQTWPEDANKGKSMTNDDLISIKELVFASNKWNDASTGIDFAIADIQVAPATDSSTDTSKDDTGEDADQEDTEEDVNDTSADIANQDPATCPITDDSTGTMDGDDTSTDPPAQSGTKTPDTTKSSATQAETGNLSNTGSDIVRVIMTTALLLLGGCAVSIAHRKKANPER